MTEDLLANLQVRLTRAINARQASGLSNLTLRDIYQSVLDTSVQVPLPASAKYTIR
jgi:hypothetical protein